VSATLADDRGVAVTQVRAQPGHPLERVAELVALTDYATAYVGLLVGVDPTPVTPIVELKARITR
jgi:glucose/mannose-6-phosphate isomerase